MLQEKIKKQIEEELQEIINTLIKVVTIPKEVEKRIESGIYASNSLFRGKTGSRIVSEFVDRSEEIVNTFVDEPKNYNDQLTLAKRFINQKIVKVNRTPKIGTFWIDDLLKEENVYSNEELKREINDFINELDIAYPNIENYNTVTDLVGLYKLGQKSK